MTEQDVELVKRPLEEWFNCCDTVFKNEVHVCSSGYKWVRGHKNAADAWDKCIRPAWLLKALYAFKICSKQDIIKLFLQMIDTTTYMVLKDLAQIIPLNEIVLPAQLQTLLVNLRQYACDKITYGQRVQSVPSYNTMDCLRMDSALMRSGYDFKWLLYYLASRPELVEDLCNFFTYSTSENNSYVRFGGLIKERFGNPFKIKETILSYEI